MTRTGSTEPEFGGVWSLESSWKTSAHVVGTGRGGTFDPTRPLSISVRDDMVSESSRRPRLGRGLGRGLAPSATDGADDKNFWHTAILKVRTGTVFGRLSIKSWMICGEEVCRRVVSVVANMGPSKDSERPR